MPNTYSPSERQILLDIAKQSIQHGLTEGRPLKVALETLPQALQQVRASFVTLELQGRLRGCIGMLAAVKPLAQDVANNAFAAAFNDTRFPQLSKAEFDSGALDIHISVLSPMEEVKFSSEEELLSLIRPGVDGLLLADENHHGTFLPAVWEDLPDKGQFLQHLKMKAGLPPNYWSNTLEVYRYTAESIP